MLTPELPGPPRVWGLAACSAGLLAERPPGELLCGAQNASCEDCGAKAVVDVDRRNACAAEASVSCAPACYQHGGFILGYCIAAAKPERALPARALPGEEAFSLPDRLDTPPREAMLSSPFVHSNLRSGTKALAWGGGSQAAQQGGDAAQGGAVAHARGDSNDRS